MIRWLISREDGTDGERPGLDTGTVSLISDLSTIGLLLAVVGMIVLLAIMVGLVNLSL